MMFSIKKPSVFCLLASLSLLGSVAQAQTTAEDLCWKQTYTRGVGTVGTTCGPNQEKQDGLCYNKCSAGYTPVGPLCWRQCPGGYTDIGVSCAKPSPTSSPGYPWQFGDGFNLDGAWARCRAANSYGCYQSGAIIYPNCAPGFQKVGDLVCSPVCPSGMRNDGAFCAKDTIARGVGTIPACGSGQTSDTGLCYPTCGSGFEGVGPVCWGSCPADYPAQCGAACAKSAAACGVAVGDMVLNTVGAAINLLSFPFGGPGVTAAMSAAKTAAKTAKFQAVVKSVIMKTAVSTTKVKAKAYGKEFVKTLVKNQFDRKNLYFTAASLAKSGSLFSMNKAATEFGVLEEQETFNLNLLMIADPTGISSAINSFAKYGSCTSEDFIPSARSVNFGKVGGGVERTITLTAQQAMKVTHITSPAFENCSIEPSADCINKQLQPGQQCTVRVKLTGTSKFNSELRIYTDNYTVIPYAVQVLANTDATSECKIHPTSDEAFNLTAVEGAWAVSNNQGNNFVMHSGGRLDSAYGAGTIVVRNANTRTFDIYLNNYSSYSFTGTMDETSGSLVITYFPKSSPATIYTLGTYVRRPWDSRCNAGQTFYAGLCYNVPATHEVTAPGFIGKPCPPDWRDDGTSCYPAWSGNTVWGQADKEGSFTMRHPIIVTDCNQYSTQRGQTCPANFKNTGGPLGCSCEALPTSKEVRTMTGTIPIR